MPLSLYIHIPWCIKKCPYCDFNSHQKNGALPEDLYVHALIEDLKTDLQYTTTQKLHSIFIGGGTPSLFSAKAYDTLFQAIHKHFTVAPQMEITLEANPGTFEQKRFREYRAIGINRLSLGIQSFQDDLLKTLGRIHNAEHSKKAIAEARAAGFENINLDLMYGLPKQSIMEAKKDLEIALSYQPEHLSWYQLNIEPNTVFYKEQPKLPLEEHIETMEQEGFLLLEKNHMRRYEISAFAQSEKQAQHNLNYWLFGDYLGIGAGAHGKITNIEEKTIIRTQKHRQPKDYLDPQKTFCVGKNTLSTADQIFEFMLNATRLEGAIPNALFEQRTHLSFKHLLPGLNEAQQKGFIHCREKTWQVTPLGRRFTNNLQSIFLMEKDAL